MRIDEDVAEPWSGSPGAGRTTDPAAAAPAAGTGPLTMFGWDHRHTPPAVLEQVAVPVSERARLLGLLRDSGCPEVVLLSTCSRTEVYVPTTRPVDALLSVVAQHRRCAPEVLAPTVERRDGQRAVEHLFRVTAGLESRIAGEPEVCGQVRRALRDARRAGTVHGVLTSVFTAAVRCAQRVRDVAGLGTAHRSWGTRAVDVAVRALRPATPEEVLVVGSGRMAADVVDVLCRRGLPPVVAARNAAGAQRLGGPERARPLSAVDADLRRADLVVVATSAPYDVVTAEQVRAARAGQARQLVVLDLSVPRNVEPGVADLPGVCLLGAHDLGDDGSTDPALADAMETGSALVRVEASRFVADVAARRAGPLISALRRRAQELCLAELQRAAPSGTPSGELERAARLVAGRLVHQPTLAARAAAAAGDADALRMLALAFGVELTGPLTLERLTGDTQELVTAAHGRRRTS